VLKVTLDLSAGSFKFRANDAWTINWGGSLGGLTQDGANIAVATAGNYTITLDPFKATGTITKN
jgi:starch-binding outer membrane protein SusE/F